MCATVAAEGRECWSAFRVLGEASVTAPVARERCDDVTRCNTLTISTSCPCPLPSLPSPSFSPPFVADTTGNRFVCIRFAYGLNRGCAVVRHLVHQISWRDSNRLTSAMALSKPHRHRSSSDPFSDPPALSYSSYGVPTLASYQQPQQQHRRAPPVPPKVPAKSPKHNMATEVVTATRSTSDQPPRNRVGRSQTQTSPCV